MSFLNSLLIYPTHFKIGVLINVLLGNISEIRGPGMTFVNQSLKKSSVRCPINEKCCFIVLLDFKWSIMLKIHKIIEHYSYYFKKTGKTFRYTNGELTESCHSTLRKSEETHGLKVNKKMGTPVHQMKS